MKKQLSMIAMLILFVIPCLIAGCNYGPPSAESIQARETARNMAEANRQVGMPNITHFTQKKTLKWIQELCDKEKLICYAYVYSPFTGKYTFLYKCIGYGIPFSAQYTNPDTIVNARKYLGYSSASLEPRVIAQQDPNGLFMPTSSDATWVIELKPDGKMEVHYAEEHLHVSPTPLRKSLVMNWQDYAIYDKPENSVVVTNSHK